jgi:hypothetical protein
MAVSCAPFRRGLQVQAHDTAITYCGGSRFIFVGVRVQSLGFGDMDLLLELKISRNPVDNGFNILCGFRVGCRV